MPLVRMKAAPVKTDGERLGNEFMNGVFFSAHLSNHAVDLHALLLCEILGLVQLSGPGTLDFFSEGTGASVGQTHSLFSTLQLG